MRRRDFIALLASCASERVLAQGLNKAVVMPSCGTPASGHRLTMDTTGRLCQAGLAPVGPASMWSQADATASGMVLSNGGLTVNNPAEVWATVRGMVSRTSGKYYVEFMTPSGTISGAHSDPVFGLAESTFNPASYLGTSGSSVGIDTLGHYVYFTPGFTQIYGASVNAPFPANDVWALAVDLTAGKIWIAENNMWFGSGDPATGANPAVTIAPPAFGLAYFTAVSLPGANAGLWTLQSSAASQKYAPPAGFAPWG